MVDEFSDTYGPFTHTAISDDDVGSAEDLENLLRNTYAAPDGSQKILFSETAWRPSLVARSDAEIHDVEYPRWAKRTHIAVEDGTHRRYIGFANLRALERLMERLPEVLAPPGGTAGKGQGGRVAMDSAGRLICAAHLAPPEWLVKEGFQFPVSTDISVYWNEMGGWEGTVFASPLAHLGEGVCGQACAYMATYPMIRHGGQVLGIADLTLLAAGHPDHPDEEDVEIGGLGVQQLRDLLASEPLCLHAFRDKVPFRDNSQEDLQADAVNQAMSVITSYLSQGLPVILLVNEAVLVRESGCPPYDQATYDRFKGPVKAKKEEEKHPPLRDNLHAILLVGFRPPDPARERASYDVVYHDSCQGPYLWASADNLAKAAGDLAQWAPVGKPDKPPLGFDFITLVPQGVRVPLGLGDSEDTIKPIGPAPSSSAWRRRIKTQGKGPGEGTESPCSQNAHFDLKCEAELTQFSLVRKQDFFSRYLSLNVDGMREREDVLHEWQGLAGKLPERFWIEEFPSEVPLTNGRLSALSDRALSGLWGWPAGKWKYARARRGWQVPLLQCTKDKLSIDFDDTQGEILLPGAAPALAVREPKLLEAGAITSFLVGPMHEALEQLAYHRIRNVDLFAFHLEDIEKRYYPADERYYDIEGDEYKKKIKKTVSPLWRVAHHKEPARIAEALARDIFAVEEKTAHRFHVRGFATYFPEVSSLDEKERREAVDALKNIIRIAGILRRDYDISPKFIEMVAGSRLSGLRTEEGTDEHSGKKVTKCYATQAARDEKLAALAKSLEEISQVAAEPDNDVYLAIEIEPGVLPLLNGPERIRDLADILSDNPKTPGVSKLAHAERVGINVDVSHMWLCGVQLQDLEDSRIRNRIAHVHIGDIGPGHMCDLVTGTVHSHPDYYQWFDFLEAVANDLPRDEGFPDFSCCLSVELEACRKPSMVAAAYHRAEFLLRKPRAD